MKNKLLGRITCRPLCILAVVLIVFIAVKNLLGVSCIESYPFEECLEDDQYVYLWGEVTSQTVKNDKTILTLDNAYLRSDSTDYPAGQLMLTSQDNSFYEIGSNIYATGRYASLRTASNPGQFDEYSYYKSKKINCRVSGEVKEVDNSKVNKYKTALSFIRRRVGQVIDDSLLSSAEAGILKAMILGDKGSIDSEQKEIYKSAGIFHLICISGLHISIIGSGLFKLLRKQGVSYLLSAVFSSLVIISYVMMTGMSVSSLRALIMFLVSLGASVLGRSTDMPSSIALSAAIILLVDEGVIYQSGFYLSFGAVLGIASMGECFKELYKDYDGRYKKLLDSLAVGLGLWIFTLPMVAYFYYESPIYSVVINMLLVPIAPIGMISGLIASIVSLPLPELGNFLFIPSKIILGINNLLAAGVNSLPASNVVIGKPKAYQLLIYYIGLALIAYIIYKRKEIKRYKPALGICFTSIVMLLFFHPRLNSQVTVLDVGQGDSILISCKSGENILMDAGSSSVKKVGENRIIPALKSLGIGRLDKLIISHPDADHINAISEIMASNISVDEILIASVHANDEKFQQYPSEKVICIESGDFFSCGETRFDILAPDNRGEDMDSSKYKGANESSNASSVVVKITEGNISGLLTGDLELEGEESLVNSGLLDNIDFLKVAHHGSKNSSSTAFLEETSPKLSLISCARKNSYGHPHKETIGRLKEIGSKIYTTPYAGAICFTLEKDRISLKTFL